MRFSYEQLHDRPVIDSTGRVVGEIDGFVVETASWRLEALRVKLRKDVTEEMEAPHGTFRAARLDVPVAFIQDFKDALILKGPIASLRTAESAPASPEPV